MQLSGELGPQQQMKTIKMELRNKYSRYLDDETMDVIQASNDPQKVAESYANVREAALLSDRGVPTEEIVDTIIKTPRTKQANGTSSQGLDYLMGVERRGYSNGPMNILPDAANNPFYYGLQETSQPVGQFNQETLYNNLLQQQQLPVYNDNSDGGGTRNKNTTTGTFDINQIMGALAGYATGIPGLGIAANAAYDYFSPTQRNIGYDFDGDVADARSGSYSTNPGIGFSNIDGDIESDGNDTGSGENEGGSGADSGSGTHDDPGD